MKQIIFRILYCIPGVVILFFLLLPAGDLKFGLFINLVLWMSFMITFLIALLESIILKNQSDREKGCTIIELLIIDAIIYVITFIFENDNSAMVVATFKIITVLNIESLLGFLFCKYVKRFIVWMIKTANS